MNDYSNHRESLIHFCLVVKKNLPFLFTLDKKINHWHSKNQGIAWFIGIVIVSLGVLFGALRWISPTDGKFNQEKSSIEAPTIIQNADLISKIRSAENYLDGESQNSIEKSLEIYHDLLKSVGEYAQDLQPELITEAKSAEKRKDLARATEIYRELFEVLTENYRKSGVE